MTSQRSERYGVADFLANCGGLMGLMLRVSAISLVELVYFCTGRCCSKLRGDATIAERQPASHQTVVRSMAKDLFTDYFKKTTIQGVIYVDESKLSALERVWWAIVVGLSILCCGSLIMDVHRQYDQSPVIISYANEETSIAEIPFPAVTICPQTVSRHVATMYDYFKVKNLSLYDLNSFR